MDALFADPVPQLVQSPWLIRYQPVSQPKLRVFAFSYAGGGASAYRQWQKSLSQGIEVVGIQLPGRETRIREPLIRNFDALIEEIASAVRPYVDEPFAFFGHSLGAVVAFEVARKLRQQGKDRLLKGMVMSACSAPQLRERTCAWHNLPDDQFIDKLKSLNGTPREVFIHPELLEIVAPIIRADFFLSDTYAYRADQYPNEAPFSIPIHVMGGLDDGISEVKEDGVTEDQLKGWSEHTRVRPFFMKVFEGDHFFIHSNAAAVLATLNSMLQGFVRG